MGPAGVGKSTVGGILSAPHRSLLLDGTLIKFIKNYTGDQGVVVSHNLESCTTDVESFLAAFPDHLDSKVLADRRLVLVDTPGFDDSNGDDAEILRRVAAWLANRWVLLGTTAPNCFLRRIGHSYNNQMTIGGIVYMHNINENRMRASLKTNLNMFMKICGEDAFKKVILATTQWQRLQVEDGERLEQQLKHKYWRELLDGGAEVMQIRDMVGKWEREIIKRSIERLLAGEGRHKEKVTLQIQKEVVDLQMSIPATQAGRELRLSLEQLLALNEKDQANALDEEERRRLKAIRAQVKKQTKALKLSFNDRLKSFFGL
jgi:hypothetical protein